MAKQSLQIVAAVGEIVDKDAIEIGELYQRSGQCQIDSLRYQVECGQRLKAKKATLLHGSWLSWLRDNRGVLGFSHRTTATRLISTASNDALAHHLDDIEPAQAVQISRKTWGHDNVIATKHTGNQESYTPAIYIEAARAVMGDIDLDPASNDLAQETVQAAKWYSAEDDGLVKPWTGRVFLNPPYAYPLVAQFIEKLCSEFKAGNVTHAVLLTNNSADTKWWHQAARTASATLQTLGRINFYQADGSETQPTNGQTFFYFGPNTEKFCEHFSDFGIIFGQPLC